MLKLNCRCLAGTYFQCCEQWFCFDKSIALYPTNESSTNQNFKQSDNFNHPYSWTEDNSAKVIISEPKARNEAKIDDSIPIVDQNQVTSDKSTSKFVNNVVTDLKSANFQRMMITSNKRERRKIHCKSDGNPSRN